jgi:LytS/YehU family sensor histidine kinase
MAFYSVDTINSVSKANIKSYDFLIANAISVSYTLAITMSLRLVKQWYERERLTQDLERINMETELKYLKSQINPHFLFNSLNSLYALTLKKSDLAPDLVLKLSDILRYVLYEGASKWVDLEKEINYIQSYLDLEKIRHGKRLDVQFHVKGDAFGRKVAPMLFLTFLENSFKHGISRKAENSYLNVDLEIGQEKIVFSICNSKPKSKSNHINEFSGGIGLENVKKRLKILYPDKYQLLIRDEEEAYCVQLELASINEVQKINV